MSNRALLQDIVNALSEKGGMNKMQSEKFCRQFFSLIREVLLRDSYVKIKGLGTFKLMTVSERESVDVNTGQRIEISAHQRIVFSPDKNIASRINRPFESFETIELSDEPTEPQEEAVADKVKPEESPAGAVADNVHTVFLGNADAEQSATEEPAEAPEQPAPVETGQTAQEEPAQEEPVLQEPQEEPEGTPESYEEEESGKSVWKILGWTLLSVLLLLASYFAGYYHLFGNTDICSPLKSSAPADTQKKDSPAEAALADTLAVKEDTLAVAAQEPTDYAAEAAKYEQIEGADYLIVGELETHEMKAGEGVIRLAQKLYGSKEMAQYVIFYNHISNPDVIPVGRKIVFPKLAKKE